MSILNISMTLKDKGENALIDIAVVPFSSLSMLETVKASNDSEVGRPWIALKEVGKTSEN